MGSKVRSQNNHRTYQILAAMDASEIDWETINEQMPYDHSEESHARRREIWNRMNVNGNKFLSLAEVDKGVIDVLGLEDVFDSKRAINEAFYFAKNSSPGDSKYGDDYLEFREFRLFLQTLRATFEFYQAFNVIDVEGDHRISKEEFCNEDIKPVIEKWTGEEYDDMEAEFDNIDENEGGMILFQEFCKWAFSKNFDLEDDVDSEEDAEGGEEEEEG